MEHLTQEEKSIVYDILDEYIRNNESSLTKKELYKLETIIEKFEDYVL